jgi:predicted dehydrogenase
VGVTYGHVKGVISDEREPVENEDIATFTARFGNGMLATFSASRVAHGRPDGLGFEVFGSAGSVAWELSRAGEFHVSTTGIPDAINGMRRVIIGPEHPYIRGGLPMDAGGVGHGKAEFFAYQARAFLDQIAGIGDLGRLPGFDTGLHDLHLIAAATESARLGGAAVKVS